MSSTIFVVDDTDSNIQYDGPWIKSSPANSSHGKSVFPFQDTLTSSQSGNVLFNFNGSSIAAFGFNHSLSHPTGNSSSRVTCYVDRYQASSPQPPGVQNYLCGNYTLHDGSHLFEINISNQSQSHISLDYLEVNTSNSKFPQSNTIKILGNDKSKIKTHGWTRHGNSTSIETHHNGSFVSINFTGTNLTWVGSIPNSTQGRINGSYSIDGKRPKSFHVNANSREHGQMIFFATEELSNQKHNINVTYKGADGGLPLVLDYLYVETVPNFPNPHSPPASLPPTSLLTVAHYPPATATDTSTSSNVNVNAGQIAGGVIGGVVFLLAALALFLFLTRRWRRPHPGTPHRQWQYRQSDISVREPLSDGMARGTRASATLTLVNGYGYNAATIEQTRAMKKGEEAAQESGRYVNHGRMSGSQFVDPLPVYNAS